MKSKNFILTSLLLIIVLVVMYIVLFFYQLKSPLKAEYWIQHSYLYKDYRAKNIKTKKIIIISGSNSLFGINSEKIKEKTGYETVNLAVHASLDIDFLYYKIKQVLKKGDIVVMPLEFGHYSRTDKISGWFSNNMMCWGKETYLDRISIFELLKFIIITEPSRIVNGAITKIVADNKNEKLLSEKKVLETLTTLWKKDGVKWRGYSYKSLNKDGDINADMPNNGYTLGLNYISKDIKISNHFLEIYHKIKKLVEMKKATLYFTYPTTIGNEKFDLSMKEAQVRINNLEEKLNQYGIDIKCNAALFQLDKKYFFNTHYHLNKYGTLIRSETLGDCLGSLINKKYKKLSYKESIQKVKKLEEKYINLVKIPNWIKRLDDLSLIETALQKFHEKNGFYPKSKGFDGFYTNWGKEGENWINGLVPEFIDKLPRDPRMLEDKGKQYLYKSNGKDYKLLAHSPEDLKIIKKLKPRLIDPTRKGHAYGVWTEGAKKW